MSRKNRLLSQQEAAAYLGICPKTMWEWRLEGIIPFVQIPGKRVRYDLKDLDEFIENNKTFEKKIVFGKN